MGGSSLGDNAGSVLSDNQQPLDTLSWTSAHNGYDAKLFEVAEKADDLISGLQRVTLREVDPDDWTPSPLDALPWEPASSGPVLPGAQLAPGVSISSEVKIINQQPIGVLVIDVAWSGGGFANAQVQYRKTGEAIWRDVGASSAGRYEVQGIDAANYDVQVRPVDMRGVPGSWLQLLDRPIPLLGLPPEDVQGFEMSIVGAVGHLTWAPVGDGDLSHYIIRWTPDIAGALYSNAITIVPKVPRPGTSALVAAQMGTYFIRAVDKLGNESLNPTAVVTTVVAVEGLNAVLTLDEAPAFTGAEVRFTEVAGLFGAATGLFSSAGGLVRPTTRTISGLELSDTSVPTSGVYEFRDPVDLGARFTSRLSGRLAIIRKDETLGLFAAAAGSFTARPGLFTGNQNFADVQAEIEVATSDDMLVWGGWRRLTVGDFSARGFRFRAVLSTSSVNVTPLVTLMQVSIDMPDRTLAAADLVSGAGPHTVNFIPAFRGLSGLGISAQGMAAGDYYQITGKSVAGFTITFKTAAGADVSRTFDYVAKGYGAET